MKIVTLETAGADKGNVVRLVVEFSKQERAEVFQVLNGGVPGEWATAEQCKIWLFGELSK